MSKVLLFVRVSTDRQELDSQLKELKECAFNDGYKEEDMKVIEGCGVSAIKAEDDYMSMLNAVQVEVLNDKSVCALYMWSLDRFGRRDDILISMKNFFIQHKINLIIAKPYLKLLNDDGSVNNGVELTFSLLATMAKQEMEVKKERFRRARERNVSQGKYNGGFIKLGFKVDEQGFFVIDEEKAELVKKIFDYYTVDGMGARLIANEIKMLGYSTKNGTPLQNGYISAILADKTYRGTIVSEEVWDKAKYLRENKYTATRNRFKSSSLSARLIVCPCCGTHLLRMADSYRCSNRIKNTCDCSTSLNVKVIDGISYFIAKNCEIAARSVMSIDERISELQESRSISLKKIEVLKSKVEELSSITERINDLYIEGSISKEKRTEKIADTKRKEGDFNNQITQLNDQVKQIESNIEDIKRPGDELWLKLYNGLPIDDVEKQSLVRKYINRIDFGDWIDGEIELNYHC